MLNFYNTRTREKEEFVPIQGKQVGLYTCGPTVYHYAHLGNLRTYVFEDILRRMLKYKGYDVNHVMNITDVGHLTDDADSGEDKMEKGAKREGKTAWEIAEFYTEAFKNDIAALNILEPTIWCKATDNIQEQINLVQKLIDGGHTYETSDGIYFDTTTIDDYGALAQLDKQHLEAGARVGIGEKKNAHDFALWKFSKDGRARQMEWDAFGKKGFPGWHIECSAMATKYLGEQFDIHCGGIDHIPVHHSNEIAQSEAATGKKPWVNVWMHGEFLLTEKDKMSKSENNFLTLATLEEKGLTPLAYRFFLLQVHYRKQLTFSWEAIEAAEQGLKNLRRKIKDLPEDAPGDPLVEKAFFDALSDNLNTAEALAALSKGLKEKAINQEMITKFDKILGLGLISHEGDVAIPEEVQGLLDQRQKARDEKNFEESDRLRDKLEKLGYSIEDHQGKQIIKNIVL
ncbi:MAG: cysteine--tRNA ligase [Candidatus Magasanikbacteria bacterium]